MQDPISGFVSQLELADIMVMGNHEPYHNFTPVVKFDTVYIVPNHAISSHHLSRDCYVEFDFDELERTLEYGGEGKWYGTMFNCITLSKTSTFE